MLGKYVAQYLNPTPFSEHVSYAKRRLRCSLSSPKFQVRNQERGVVEGCDVFLLWYLVSPRQQNTSRCISTLQHL
jgi:hypothetical protein